MKDGVITGKKGQTQELLGYGKTAIKRAIIVGLGKEDDSVSAALRHIAGQLGRHLQEKKEARMTIALPETILEKITAREAGQSIVEGLAMGIYDFDGYQKKKAETKKEKTQISELVLKVLDKELVSEIDKGLSQGLAIAEGVNTARDLGNTPANILTPKEIVDRAKDLEKKYKSLSIEILDAKKAKKLGMNAFLGVAQGSAQE